MASSPIYLAEAKGTESSGDSVPGLQLSVTKCTGLSDAMKSFRASMHVRMLVHAGEGPFLNASSISIALMRARV